MVDHSQPRDSIARPALSLFLIGVGLFVALRYLGGILFENNWALVHWRYLPVWYGPVWIVVAAGLLHAVYHYTDRIDTIVGARWFMPTGLAIAALAALLLSFDSFVYGGGNLLVSQTAQMETLVMRGAEPLSTLLVAALKKMALWGTTKPHIAAWFAWRIYSYLFAVLAAWGALLLAKQLTSDRLHRLWIGLILLMGGQTLSLLGFVGVEATVVAATIWTGLMSLRVLEYRRSVDLAAMWAIVAVAVVLYMANLYLVPAAVYVTVMALQGKRSGTLAGAAAAISGLVLLGGLYTFAAGSFPFARYLMFFTGKNPFGDYGLFSMRHIGDVLQTSFVAAPLVIVAAGLLFRRQEAHSRFRSAALTLTVGGLAALWVIDPVQGGPFDFPRLAAYLSPAALLLAVTVAVESRRLAGMTALFATMTLFAYLPLYTSIERAPDYVTPYLDKHPALYRDACLTFRDAYFARGEFSKADEWERQLTLKSPEVINLRGITTLSMQGDVEEALRVLYPVIARFPYWSEPRDLAARIQMRVGRYALARPQIDTLLLINPYDKQHLTLLYEFLRDGQNLPEALAQAARMQELYPDDKDVAIDFMVANYRAGQYAAADSVAGGLLTTDSTMGYPHLIKGMIAERDGLRDSAISHYHRFIDLSPNAPEVAVARKRLAQLEGTGAPTP